MALALGIDVVELAETDSEGAGNAIAPSAEEMPLRLPSGFRWIVLESKEDPKDISAERWEQLLGAPIVVVKTRNGFSAAAVGPFEKAAAEGLVESLRRSGLAPEDSYLSSGNGFTVRLR